MKTIRETAVKILTDNMNYANDQIRVKFIGKAQDDYKLFTLRSYVENEAKSNPAFFRWLFNDYSIAFFGTTLTREQREAYETWLHDL